MYIPSEINTNLSSPWTVQNGKAVAPAVAMVEGVHVGSQGAVLHTAEKLEQYARRFEGVPVTLDHPVDANGQFCSVNQAPDYKIGTLRNVRFDRSKKGLVGHLEICLNGQKCVIARQSREVSLGIFCNHDNRSGVWNGEYFQAVALDYVADHVAILPDGQRGACSWQDTCGIRSYQELINNQNIGEIEMNEFHDINLYPADVQGNKDVKQIKYQSDLQVNEQGLRELIENIKSFLDSHDTENKTHFLEEVYSNEIVYSVREDGQETFLKAGYEVDETGGINLTTEPVPVKKTVDFEEIATNEQGVPHLLPSEHFKGESKTINSNEDEVPPLMPPGMESPNFNEDCCD